MGELNTRLATIVDRNSGILNENKHLKQTMDMEKQKYSDEVDNLFLLDDLSRSEIDDSFLSP